MYAGPSTGSLITPSTFDPDKIVTDMTRAAKMIEALSRIGINIGLELGRSVSATCDATALAGDFTTTQHGWATATAIEYDPTGTW